MRVLNFYAGIGGNRKHWTDCHVTAVERQEDIADAYRKLYPGDNVIDADAHKFLLNNYDQYNFIWSSPPCQSHSKMDRANSRNKPRYPDLTLYEEIIFLQTYAKCPWVVENVVPYYSPLVQPTQRVGRHLFWSNFHFLCEDVERPKGFIASGGQATAKALQDWLGIHYEKNLYYGTNHCPAQVLRNAVHPEIGRQIFNQVSKQ